MSLVSINPATGQRIHLYGTQSSVRVEAILRQAKSAFMGWREAAPITRADSLRALAQQLRRQKNDLAQLLTTEVGKPITQALAEIEKSARVCEFYAKHGADFLTDEHPKGAPQNAQVVYEPLGTILAVMPWNFPFWQVFRAAAPTLMAGNTVILKHAPNVTGCALAIEQVFRDAAVPQGVFHNVLLPAGSLPSLIRDSRIAGLTLTGSTAAGRALAAEAGAALKPCLLELGGSDPYLVLEDADLDHAAALCAKARFINSGQSCISAKRLIVHKKVQARFEEKLLNHIAALQVGDPTNLETQIGPLARHDLREVLHAQVTRSISLGAACRLGGSPLPGAGFFYAPTLLTGVTKGMPAFDEEVFGPVAVVITAHSDEEAISLANDTDYGLGAAIFTQNKRRARELAPRLEAGMVFVNEAVHSEPTLPFGGIKQSGLGRELGLPGIRAFVNTKTLWLG